MMRTRYLLLPVATFLAVSALFVSSLSVVTAAPFRQNQPQAGGPSITLEKGVGTSGGVCATTDTITITAGTRVYYCYRVTNTGNVTLTRHDLEDSELGTILNDFPFTLLPSASAFLTQTTLISETTVNTGTWTAFNPGLDTASATDAATVTIEAPTAITLLTPLATNQPRGVAIWLGGVGVLVPLGSWWLWRRRGWGGD